VARIEAHEHPTSQPPLARSTPAGAGPLRRVLARIRVPRRLKVTREGRYFIAITLLVGFAAVNTGNNLLFLLLGMLLSLMVVSGVLSEFSLRHLTVVRRLPARAQAGRPHLVEIEVRNHKKRIPSYAIEVEDLRASHPADKRCFFLKVSPRSAQVAAYRRTPAKRGRDQHIGFRVATRFPFGLFEKSHDLAADGELIIYPPVDAVLLPPSPPGQKLPGTASLGRGHGDEVLGLRPMRDGDDPHDIYWRKSTTTNQMVLLERARETRYEVRFAVNCVYGDAPAPSDAWLDQFERHIREVASRAVAHIKRGDLVLVFASPGRHARADRSVGADPVLRFLALLEPVRAHAPHRPEAATALPRPTAGTGPRGRWDAPAPNGPRP
jgi:uncharacterized protein (DUF58 family)